MGDPSILFVKPQAISAKDKKALQGAGVIVIEIENPQDAKFVRAGAELSGSQMLMAAAEALESSDVAKRVFAEALCHMLRAKPQEVCETEPVN